MKLTVWFHAACAATTAGACVSDDDCSLNGACHAGTCRCDAAWSGSACSVLQVLPATRAAGLHSMKDGRNVSSWGGSVVELDGEWHMYASQMVNHCGINAWTENSHIVHATSSSPGGTYGVKDVVFPVFSHEPNVVTVPPSAAGPDGERLAMFFTAAIPSKRKVCNCTDGSTSGPCGGTNKEGGTYVSWARSAAGPWSEPALLWVDPARGSDTNLAPVILENGTLVGIWRRWRAGSWPRLATATHWRDASSYVFHEKLLFPRLSSMGAEDPHVYLDGNRRFHAVFHNMDPCHGYPCPGVSGGHAYSRNGLDWTYTGVAYSATPVRFDDGTSFNFSRQERPHVIQDALGRITHLTTGVQYGGEHRDAVYTLLQPVQTGSGAILV